MNKPIHGDKVLAYLMRDKKMLRACPICGEIKSLVFVQAKEVNAVGIAICCNAKLKGCGLYSGYKMHIAELLEYWNKERVENHENI